MDYETVNLRMGALGIYGGVRIVETIHATTPVEDWSGVRSPGRARRRRKKYPQRIRTWMKPTAYEAGGIVYAHPEYIRQIRWTLKRRLDEKTQRMFFGFTP